MRVVKHWTKLPRKAVEPPFPVTFKTQLDKAVSDTLLFNLL